MDYPKIHEGVNELNVEILAVDYSKLDVMIMINYNQPYVLVNVRYSNHISRLL